MSEVENVLDEFNTRLDIIEEEISEFENIAIETKILKREIL